MTTAELGIVSTAVVGVAAALSPAVTALLNRKHERDMARAARKYDARSRTYSDVVRFLEAERLKLERTVQRDWWKVQGREPPGRPSDEEWIELQGAVAAFGSRDVQEKLRRYHATARPFYDASIAYLSADMRALREKLSDDEDPDAKWVELERVRAEALERIDEAEAAIRDEFAKL